MQGRVWQTGSAQAKGQEGQITGVGHLRACGSKRRPAIRLWKTLAFKKCLILLEMFT